VDGDETIEEARAFLAQANAFAGSLRGWRGFQARRIMKRQNAAIEKTIQNIKNAQREARAKEPTNG
jgi:hypothetical protein